MTKKMPKKYYTAENIFLVCSLIVGCVLVFLVPIGANYDEDTHVARIWEMAHFKLVPNSYLGTGPHFPQIFYELSFRQKDIIRPISIHFWREQLGTRIDWGNMINHQTRSVYFPTLYAIQALLMGFMGRFLDTPIIIIYYILRLSYLAIYIALSYLSIKIIPFGKYVLTFLALTPMALLQASSISPDAISNGGSFLFFAWMLHVVVKKEKPLSRKELYFTYILVALLAMLKVNSLPLFLLLLFIPKNAFGDKKCFIFHWVVSFAIVLLLGGGWNIIASKQTHVFVPGIQIDALGQSMNIISKPLEAMALIAQNLIKNFWNYGKEWIGVFGYGYWELPSIYYALYPIVILLIVFSEEPGNLLNVKRRIGLGLLCLLGILFTIIIFYLFANPVDAKQISFIQGRYFIPVVPLALFALIPEKPILPLSTTKKNKWFISTKSILGILFILSTFAVYYVNCGSSYFQPGLCYYPKNKNWAPNANFSKPIISEIVFAQTFISECEPMKELQIWVRGNNAGGVGETQIMLLDSFTNKEITSKNFTNAKIGQAGWLTIKLPEDMDNTSGYYSIIVLSDNDVSGIQVGLSLRDEYLDGQLTINDEEQSNDILFRYGCPAGLSALGALFTGDIRR